MNQRGWTTIDEDMDEDTYEKVKPIADALAHEWSRLHHEEEQERFHRAWEREEGMHDYDVEPEEALYMETMERLKRERHNRDVLAIEEEMERLGVRMMRAYEHWNEDEAYMEYMERDR